MSLAVFVLTHLAFASLLAALAVAVGRRLVALAGPAAPALPAPLAPPATPAVIGARWGLPLAAGLGAIGCALALLAAAGRLTTPWVVLVLAAAAGAAAPEWRPLLAEVAGTAGAVGRAGIMAAARRPRRWPWAVAAVLAAAPVLALALYPPTGFDALLYHLPAAARFAASGRIEVAPELRFPAFPWLNEILFAAALLLQDDVAAQLVECLAFLGVAALLWEMGRRRGGPWAGALGAALWLGSPLAAWAAASAYVEPLEALFVLAAVEVLLLAAELPTVDGGAPDRSDWLQRAPDPRALALAGALAGCAAAVKYQGLFAVALVAVLAVWPLRGGGAPVEATLWRRRRLAPLVVLAGAAAVALPWYVWIGAATGDPLFPMLTRLTHPRAAGVPGLGNWRNLPWRLLVQKIWPYPPGSPWLWLLAPLPLLARRRFPQAARFGIAGLALALATAAVHPDGRMIAVAAPLFCAGIAAVLVPWSLARWGAAGAAPRLLAITLLALLPGWCYTVLLAARRGAIPSDAAARESYLRRQLPAYGALSWLNSAHGRQYAVYGLWAENLRYYAAGRFVGDWYGAWPFAAALRAAERPAELRAFLLRAGADHLLVRRQPGKPGLLPCGDARFAPFLRGEHCDGEASVWAVATPPRRGGP
jgi:hypothetical protein